MSDRTFLINYEEAIAILDALQNAWNDHNFQSHSYDVARRLIIFFGLQGRYLDL